MPRYIYKAAVRITVAGVTIPIELWQGIESVDRIDVQEFSRETGFDLTPADGISDEELASVGVVTFNQMEG